MLVQRSRLLSLAILGVICTASLVIKISQTDFAEPVYFDALEYNTYAWNISHGLGNLPVIHNVLFSLFLAPIFSITPDFMTSSAIQKTLTLCFSTINIMLFYKLARRFFEWRFALLGCILLAFEPHIIQNVSFGIIEPMYIFFMLSSLYLATSKDQRLVVLSYAVAGLSMAARFEGVMILPLLAGLHIYKKQRLVHIGIGVLLFAGVVFCFISINQMYGTHENIVTAKINHEVNVISQNLNTPNDGHHTGILKKLAIGVVYMGWSTFPVFIWFIPIGFYYILKRRPVHPGLIIGVIAMFAIPGLQAYLRAFDTRYFIQLYPFLALLCVYGFYNLEKTWLGKLVKGYMARRWMEIIISVSILAILFPFAPNLSTAPLTEGELDGASAVIPNVVFIYPTYTLSAYDTHGFYTYYKGLCDTHCLTIPDRFNNLDRIKQNVYGLDTIKSMGYKILTDRQVDENPQVLDSFDTVIVLHNEYVTQKEFDAITHHRHVIYLYPNSLYALVQRNQDNSLTLIRGHNYPALDIHNGFNWEYDNSKLEYVRDCTNFHFYKINNGYMLNCYPEDIINSSPTLWEALSKI